jgi:hypothetical protein
LRGGPDTVVEPTTETVAPTPEATVSGLSFEWTRVTLPGTPSKESIPSDESTVAVFDGGLVVAAHNHIWMSPDGVNWTMTNTFPDGAQVRDHMGSQRSCGAWQSRGQGFKSPQLHPRDNR